MVIDSPMETLPMATLMFGLWVILKNPCLITRNNFLQQVRIGIKILKDVLAHLHALYFLFTFKSFGTIFAQTLHILKSSMIICLMLFQPNPSLFEINRTVNQWSPHTIFFTSLALVLFLLVHSWDHPHVLL